ncbi:MULTISPECIES: D-erythronate dehydrogenase [unclassified Undibacterium]|uniref:D-erythronate dehydrogenase n=1 Tax=unclassified Undibacterium TaxID=2630295 RepID=UPI002AC9BED2|nr:MULTISPECIES: D-erythronate dehydrogenase [unclassified Undibacterium]MEB0140881.1 SDR family oxidoreductase [Undibacterium sp. CCC2.1]MEB0173850.1 SDR family oxidoreductase [Undibacterium sp. CCC1.1]MEB0177864.1 SDR family oxidoreductase [Undibacterium sp. CCC3.4]MEB0217085.1 SDR family oxidoreductase [Undibacterium sp. 5I2]WPX45511.1 SDR family oxidoreductase [Undibacterium sp. CCC3.4]
MKVLITGGAGFLGQKLARALLARGTLSNSQGVLQTIDQLILIDVIAAPDFGDSRVKVVTGDITDGVLLRQLIDAECTSIFHLAAIVSGQAEADFDLGMRINLDAARLLLDICRERAHQPKLVFTSSVAVYGGTLPDLVQDSTALNPQSSYGAQKAIAELLLNDFSRKGYVDGRVLRLPTISVRPGKPNKAASSFASGIIREPLHGESSVCPVAPELGLWLLSPQRAIESLILGHELPAAAFGVSRTINLPGLAVRVSEMVAALAVVAGPEVVARIQYQPDPAIERIVQSWPSAWDTTRARLLGFSADENFAAIIRAYLADA